MKLILSLIFAAFSLVCLDAAAADKYVRKGASGSGTSWSDAYGELGNVNWSGMSGSTLWVAAGSYTSGLPDLNVSNVTIKRATVAAHGTGTGWSDSFDGQVNVTPGYGSPFLQIASAAAGAVVDGSGYAPWKFRVLGVKGYNGMLQNAGADNVVIRGIEFDGLGESTPYGGAEDGLRWMGGSNAIIEHNYIHDYRQVGESHNDGVQGPACTNITFRHNVFKNNGMHIFLGDYAWGSRYCNGITINHNVFYNDANGGSYNAIVFKGSNSTGTYTNRIDNNVFNLRGQGSVLYLADSPAPGCCNNLANGYFRNNIVYASSVGNIGFYSRSNNILFNSGGASGTASMTVDPLFADVAANDYRLKVGSPAIGAGLSLGYAQDMLGAAVTAPASIGAYQTTGAPTATVSPPTNLRVQ